MINTLASDDQADLNWKSNMPPNPAFVKDFVSKAFLPTTTRPGLHLLAHGEVLARDKPKLIAHASGNRINSVYGEVESGEVQ